MLALAAARLEPRRRAAQRDMNRQIDARRRGSAMALLVALVVGHDLLADLGAAGARARARTTRSSASQEFEIRRGLILVARAGCSPATAARKSRRQDALLPPLPAGAARRARRRLLDGRPGPRRARAVAQRRAHRHRAATSSSLVRAVARRARRQADRRRHRRAPRSTCDGAAGRARGARDAAAARSSALDPRNGQAARDGLVAELRPEPRRERLRPDRRDHGRLPARRRRSLNRATPGPLPAGLDLQGRDRVGRARLAPYDADLDVRRPRLLHRVRQAGQQLRHEPARSARSTSRPRCSTRSTRCSATSAQALGAKRILDTGEEVRLLRAAAARDARRASGCPSGLYRRRRALVSRSATRTSTPAAWPSGRSACSSRRCRWRWSRARSATRAS